MSLSAWKHIGLSVGCCLLLVALMSGLLGRSAVWMWCLASRWSKAHNVASSYDIFLTSHLNRALEPGLDRIYVWPETL